MLVTALLFLVGLKGAHYLSLQLGIKTRLGILLYLWHSIFVFVFHQYVITHGGDALDYYNGTVVADAGQLGSGVVLLLVKSMSIHLSFSMLDCSVVFGFFGYAGLMLWLKILLSNAAGKRILAISSVAIVFMPSFSFWTAGIGKDAIFVLAIALVVASTLACDTGYKSLVAGLALMASVRPHLAMLIGFLWGVASLYEASIASRAKVTAIAVIIGLLVVKHEYFLKYVGYLDAVGKVAYENGFSGYVEALYLYNKNANSGIDVGSMGGVELFFSYFFRPTIWEANTQLQMVAAVENCLLMVLTVMALVGMRGLDLIKLNINRWGFLVCCAASISTGYALISSNFGISARTKWMVVPLIILLLRLKPVGPSAR
jgi:hypothetical protein